ncbi:hypothetical protein C8T65DRAFT_588695, partial [Cerioporus squamosus]
SYCVLPEPKRIWLGDDCYILAVGVGSMYLDLVNHDSPILVSHVFHVPDLHGNLLSVSHLVSGSYTIKFI